MDLNRNYFMLHSLVALLLYCEALTTAQNTTTQQTLTECSNNSNSSLIWRPYQDSCYSAYTESFLSYEAGRDFCIRRGGYLVSVHSSSEMQFIVSLAGSKSNSFWIGLRKNYPYEYRWEDETAVDFTNWATNDEDSSPLEFPSYPGDPDYYVDISDLADTLDMCASFRPPRGYWVASSCSGLYHVICKYRRVPEVSGPVTAAPTGFCSEGWYTFDDSCYKIGGRLSRETKSWFDASDQCEAIGSQLVSVHSERERDFLNTLMLDVNRRMWIGLSRTSSDEEFKWKDDSALDYSNWNEGEPNNHLNSDENCVQMLDSPRELGLWNDAPCRLKFPYICKKPRDPTITRAPLDAALCAEPAGWLKVRSSCYKVFNEPQIRASWDQAKYACANSSAILASVKSFQITAELRSHMEDMTGYFWIGISSTAKHRYTWIGGSPLIYSNWESGQPKDVQDGNNCVAMNTYGEWMIKNCNENLPFICEVNEGSPETSVLPPRSSNITCPDFSPKWHDFGGEYCYIIEVEQKIKWYEASCACSKEGGFLASFHSSDQIDLLLSYLKDFNVPLHIGFERNSRGRFVWADGSPADFDNWAPGQPNSDREQCTAMLTNSGKWNDVHCSSRHGYICSVHKATDVGKSPVPSSVSLISEPHSASSIALITVCTLCVLVIGAVALFYYFPSLKAPITGKIPFGKLQS